MLVSLFLPFGSNRLKETLPSICPELSEWTHILVSTATQEHSGHILRGQHDDCLCGSAHLLIFHCEKTDCSKASYVRLPSMNCHNNELHWICRLTHLMVPRAVGAPDGAAPHRHAAIPRLSGAHRRDSQANRAGRRNRAQPAPARPHAGAQDGLPGPARAPAAPLWRRRRRAAAAATDPPEQHGRSCPVNINGAAAAPPNSDAAL